MGQIWWKSGSLEWDDNGELAEDAVAYFYAAGTSTPTPIYQDGGESIAHENPVEADSARWPEVFVPFGSYKVIIKSAVGGTTLFSADNIPNPAPNDEEVTVDEEAILNTGDIFISLRNGSRAGAVRLNGRTIGDASSGATERANADCSDLFVYCWNNMLNAQAAVSGGRGASGTADFAAHKTLALPDWRGCTIVGFDGMGNSQSSLLAAAPVVNGGVETPGSILGANTHTLLTAESPSHTHSFSATTGNESVDHHHGVTATTSTESADHTHSGTTSLDGSHAHSVSGGTIGGTATFPTGIGGGGEDFPTNVSNIVVDFGGSHQHTMTTGGKSATHTHDISVNTGGISANHTHSVSGTSGSTGGGGAHNNISRAGLVTFFIKL